MHIIFSKPKDHVPREQWTDSVYSIPYKDFKHVYIRQTKRQFGTCLEETTKRQSFFVKKKSQLCWNMLAKPTIQIEWNNSEIIIYTTNQQYHQHLCLEAWHISSTHSPLNHDDGGLLPYTYLRLINNNKCSLESEQKELCNNLRSPQMMTLDSSVETTGSKS